MVALDPIIRQVPAGTPIKPWIAYGPLYEDLSAYVEGLTLFERAGATVGRAAMADVVAEAQTLFKTAPREGDIASFRGHIGRWELVRRPEPYLAWGRYFISNHLGAIFLATVVRPTEPGKRRFRLTIRITSRVLVTVDGVPVFDTDAQPVHASGGNYQYEFEATLKPGDSTLGLAVFRLGRMAQVGMRLEMLDGELEAHVPLADGMETQLRAQIEQQLASIALGRDLFYPGDTVGIRVGAAALADAPLAIRLVNDRGETIVDGAAGDGLCAAADLADGTYLIVCEWRDRQERLVTSTAYDIIKTTPTPQLPGEEHAAARRLRALEHYATDPGGPHSSHARIWPAVANYTLGRYDAVDEQIIRDICLFISARKDCADFAIQGLLRLMYWERREQRLSPAINALMKDTVLGFKYWVDEPGDTVMYMGSENHRLLFHVAEWMAGQLFPTEEFTNSRMRGLYHATKGRMYITEWIRQRGRYGFDEWHSNSYYPICIAPLLNVYDFVIAEDAKLRQMAGAILDVMCFNLAADSFHGMFGTTHGRSYGKDLLHPDFEGTAAISWLLFGQGAVCRGTSGMAPVAAASSTYKVPAILQSIATDNQAVVDTQIRQGIFSGTARHANYCVYRTPDYMLSALQDHRKGEYESSTHVGQVTLPNRTLIFFSCPQTSGEGSGLRPDYWSGHTTLPRVIQYRNIMALTWRLTEQAWMSHCFFEQERFDELRFSGNWTFARAEKAFVAIYSQHGMRVGNSGQYAGRELVCEARENTWLVECGRAADWGSFEAFTSAIQAAPIQASSDSITYDSPSVGRFVTGWDATPTIDGKPIKLHGYPLVESAWASSRFGSGEYLIRHGEQEYEIWLNQ